MKLTLALLLALSPFCLAGRSVGGWIYPLDLLPVGAHPLHPRGELVVIREAEVYPEYSGTSQDADMDIQPAYSKVTLLTPDEADRREAEQEAIRLKLIELTMRQ